jgi:hypothetical protein
MKTSFVRSLGLLAAVTIVMIAPAHAQNVSLQTAPDGMPISGVNPLFHSGFGNVNGLGAGTTGTGLSVIATGVAGGVLYKTNYSFSVTAAGSNKRAVIKAFVSANFLHPSILQLRSCSPSSSCNAAGAFNTLSTNAAAPTEIIPVPGVGNGIATASLALFVSSANGSGTFAGSDTATITFVVYAYDSGNDTLTLNETDTLALDNPSANVQTALRLSMSMTPGGLTISPASDYSINFGSVNGLGIGPAAGLMTRSVTGGVLYSTSYQLQAAVSSFTNSSGTMGVYVSTDFAHPAILELRDSPDNSTFTAISKNSAAQTTLPSSIGSTNSQTRYLGVFVSNTNGPTAFSGADNARLTYTLTAP